MEVLEYNILVNVPIHCTAVFRLSISYIGNLLNIKM